MSWEKIESQLNKLPPAQRNVASYMLTNREKSIFMTAAELGRSSGSSEATAVRLAATLGYGSFPDLIKSLQHEAQQQLSTLGRLQLHNFPPRMRGYVTGVIAKDLELAKDYMSTAEENDEALKSMAAEICKAEAIYLLGLRSTRCLVHYMEYYLSWFFAKVLIPHPDSLENSLTSAPKRSLMLGMSFPRYTRQTVDCFSFAKKCGIRTAAITDSLQSPLAEYADIVVTAPCSHIAHIDSLLVPLGMVNALLIEVAKHLGPAALHRLEELEKTWEESNIYC